VTAPLVLALDQGTTNTKALLLDREGQIVASASRPVPIRYPEPAWVEQDAEALWRSVVEAAGDCLDQAGAERPAAIGISNQRESVVVWDRKTRQPVAPCIIWQCRRTAPFCAELRAQGSGTTIRERSGLAVDPLFSASKARWILEHVPDGFARAANGELAIGTVDSWLLWNLTGGRVHACDRTNASRTQLMNLRSLEWDATLCSLFSIPAPALPEIRPSSHLHGETVACDRIRSGIPIAASIGDSHAAAFGHGMFSPGSVKATYGTGSSLMTVTDRVESSSGGLSSTVAWSIGDRTRYALEGNISVTGGAVQWLGDFLRLPDGASGVAELASSVLDSGGVYLVPAFVGLGAPYWNDGARGLLTGLTRGTAAAHAARAGIEAIAYQVRDVFEAMERDVGQPLPALRADGGASRNDFLMQFQADMLGRAVVRTGSADLSAIGAAWMAGLATGVWRSLEDLSALPRCETRFEPRMDEARRAQLYDGWLRAVSRAMEK
jgi:glycerol kinase